MVSQVAASPAGRRGGIFAALPCCGPSDEHHYSELATHLDFITCQSPVNVAVALILQKEAQSSGLLM